MGADYLRVWRVSHLVEVHKGGASLVQMQDLVIFNHLRHNCFHQKRPCGQDNGSSLGKLERCRIVLLASSVVKAIVPLGIIATMDIKSVALSLAA